MIRSEHICRYRVTGKDGQVKGDRTFNNFAFAAGLDLISQFFRGGSSPTEFYLGLIKMGGGGTPRAYVDDAAATEGWVETTCNYDAFPLLPDVANIPRQPWVPTLAAWDDGIDRGWEVSGDASWTATGFFRYGDSSTSFPDWIGHLAEGVVLFAGEDAANIEWHHDGVNVVFPSSNPLFMAIGETTYLTSPEVGETIPDSPGVTGHISPGDVIDVTYKIRFSVEELEE